MNAINNISGVKIRQVLVTVELAKLYLAMNTSNRPINKGQVKLLSRQMTAGKFKLTTDAIGVSSTGRLVNGQHRLAAVVDSGVACLMLVAEGLEDDSYEYTDRGTPRKISDAMREDPILVTISSFLTRFVWCCQDRIANHDLRLVIDALKPCYQKISHVNVKVRPARTYVLSAALVTMMDADSGKSRITHDFVVSQLESWVSNGTPTRVMWQFLTFVSQPVNRSRTSDCFLKAFHLFDPNSQDNEKLYMKPRTRIVERIRELLPIPAIQREIRHKINPLTGEPIKKA